MGQKDRVNLKIVGLHFIESLEDSVKSLRIIATKLAL